MTTKALIARSGSDEAISSSWLNRPRLMDSRCAAPAAAARRLDNNDLIGAERQARLAGFVANLAVALHDIIMAGLGIGAAMQPVRSEAAALALQRDARGMVEAADRAHE